MRTMKKKCVFLTLILLTLMCISFSASGAEFEVQYACRNSYPYSKQIQPNLNIKYKYGEHTIALKDLTLRYYYSKSGHSSEKLHIDYAVIGGGNIAYALKQGYFELSFRSGAGYLAPGCDTGQIQVRLHKSDWSLYNQKNDYSFGQFIHHFEPWKKITLYHKGQLVWGTPPCGIPTPTPAATPEPTPAPVIEPGTFYMIPAALTVNAGDTFTTNLLLNSGNQLVAAYGIEFIFLPSIITVNTSMGYDGIVNGTDGFLVDVNASEVPVGSLFVAGFDTTGRGPGTELDFFELHWIALNAGEADIGVDVNSLVDLQYDTIGYALGLGSHITVVGQGPDPTPLQSPTPTPEAGKMWFEPTNKDVVAGDSFSTEIHLNTGSQRLGFYGLYIMYSGDIINADISIGNNGVLAGVDGFLTTVEETRGLLTISGSAEQGTGPGTNLHILTINWKAMETGTAGLSFNIFLLTGKDYKTIGAPRGIPGSVTVHPEGSVIKDPGTVWFEPSYMEVYEGDIFTNEIHVSTGDQLLVAYEFEVDYDRSLLQVEDIRAGADGFLSAGAATLADFRINGFDVLGVGPGADLHIITATWTAIATGTSDLEIEVDTLIDDQYNVIGTPSGTGSTIVIKTTDPYSETGAVWFEPVEITVTTGQNFDTGIYVNTGDQLVAAYGFDITYNSNIVTVGPDGIRAGSDGFFSAACAGCSGAISVSGFDAMGKGPGSRLHLLTINWTALEPGSTSVYPDINSLTDDSYNDLGIPFGIPGSITVIAPTEPPTEVPPPGTGAVSFDPENMVAYLGDNFSTNVIVNSGTQDLSAYGININYNSNIVAIENIKAGSQGFLTAYNASVAGTVTIAGFDVNGIGPGTRLQLLTIDWITRGVGVTNVEPEVQNLTDSSYNVVGVPYGIPGTITVNDAPPEHEVGELWFEPAELTTEVGESFSSEIHLNTGNQRLVAYGIDVTYNFNILSYESHYRGVDGFVSATSLNGPGQIVISGFDAIGVGPGSNLHLVTIDWYARSTGTTTVSISVNTLADETYEFIGTPMGLSGRITVIDSGGPTPTTVPTSVSTPVQASPSPAPVSEAGLVRFEPADFWVAEGEEFTVALHVESPGEVLGAYGFYIDYDPDILSVITSAGQEDGVEPGADGFLAAVQPDSGRLAVSGFDTDGRGPSPDLELIIIHFSALAPGSSALDLTVRHLVAEDYSDLGTPRGENGRVNVIADPCIPGVVALELPGISMETGSSFTTPVLVSTGTRKLAAYGFDVFYNEHILAPVPSNEVEPGSQGYVSSANVYRPGQLKVAGFDVSGVGPSDNLELCLINWQAIEAGNSKINLVVDRLVDEHSHEIGVPRGTYGNIVVTDFTVWPTEPPPYSAGSLWFVPQEITVQVGHGFSTEIHLNTGNQKLAAYGIDIVYDKNILYSDSCITGDDGFISVVNMHNRGCIVISGFDPIGVGPGSDLHLATLNWTAQSSGTSDLSLAVNSLVDERYTEIGNPAGIPGRIKVIGTGGPSFTPIMTPSPTPPTKIPPSPIPTPVSPGGLVWFEPADFWVAEGEKFTVALHVESPGEVLGAYGFYIDFDPAILSVTASAGQEDGVEPGEDGFMASVHLESGRLSVGGFDTDGRGPSPDLELIIIHFSALAPGSSPLDLTIRNLIAEDYSDLGTPRGENGLVHVIADPGTPGAVSLELPGTPKRIGSSFTTPVLVSTGTRKLAAYGFDVFYNEHILAPVPTNEVEPGSQGYVSSANVYRPGQLKVAGFDASGVGPSDNLELCLINWQAIESGNSKMNLVVDRLVDEHYNNIGIPRGTYGTIAVTYHTGPTSTPANPPTRPPTPSPSAAPIPAGGRVWFEPSDVYVPVNTDFSVVLHVETPEQQIGAAGLDILYDPGILEINTAIGNNGVELFTEGNSFAVNPGEPGRLRIGTHWAEGWGPSPDLEFLKIHFTSIAGGISPLDLVIDTLIDLKYRDIGTLQDVDGTVYVDTDPRG